MRGLLSFSLALVPLALSKTIDVAVGQGGLMFTPSIVTADPGDKVDFHFFPMNHSVVQSSFAEPCVPIKPDGGIFSGFHFTKSESPDVFEVTVNDTTPIWIYCAQAKHCQKGMSMVINQPSNKKTLAAYQAAAKDVPKSSSPPNINGGIFLTKTNTNGTSSNSTSSGNGTSGYSSGSKTGSSSSSQSSIVAFAGAASAGAVAELSLAVFVAMGTLLMQV